MAVVTKYGSRIMTGLANTYPPRQADPGEGGGMLRGWFETVETAATDEANSTYTMARVHSSVRVFPNSKLSWDDLATTGSPTLDVGIFPVRPGDFTGVAAALNDGLDAAGSGAPNTAPLVKDYPAAGGKQLWEYVSTLSADPKCLMDIKVTLMDANITTAGTIAIEFYYSDS